MDTLFSVLISGMAVAYLVELISLSGLSPKRVKLIVTLPSSYLFCWYLGITGFPLVVAGCATAFVSLILLLLVAPPVQVVRNRQR
jgi:hypothetical protein